MAEKEAYVFVVDVGRSMGQKKHGRVQSDLDWSLQYVWDKVSNIVSSQPLSSEEALTDFEVYLGRKGQVVGVIGLRTNETKNHMMQEDGYEHITVLQDITQILMPQLQRMPTVLTPSATDDGDALSAVILAVDMILKHCRHLKFTKKICLVTNGTGSIDPDDIESTAEQIKQNNIEFTVLGVDFDDPEYGFKEENKPFRKAENENLLKKLVDLSGGTFATMKEVIDGLSRPYVKTTKPVPTYKGELRLGGPDFDTAVTIEVERYFKVSVRRPPTASSFAVREGATQAEADGLTTVRNAYTYSVKDESAPNGKRDIPREDLAKGYEYGRTAVHISESDENITKLETDAAYEILGFIPAENVERYMVLDNTNILVARKLDSKAAFALSSLVHALFELGSCAIARFVKKDMSEPQLTLLSPLVTGEIECLIENDLPFAEDIRQYRFPPLDKIVTVSGKTLTSHRNLPNDELLSAMDQFVDNLSLMNGEERFAMDDTFSPLLHTVEGAIKYRAVHPRDPIPPKPEVLLEPSRQPADLQDQSKDALQRLIKAADVKKVPPKAKGRRRYREQEKPLSGLDVASLLKKEDRLKIAPDNAIPEFKQILETTDKEEVVKDAVKQMSAIVQDQIATSFGDNSYDRAAEGLGTMRQELVELEMPELYNNALTQIKKRLLAEELGGNRKEFWWKVRVSRLGLIDKTQSESSDVSKEQASEFLTSR